MPHTSAVRFLAVSNVTGNFSPHPIRFRPHTTMHRRRLLEFFFFMTEREQPLSMSDARFIYLRFPFSVLRSNELKAMTPPEYGLEEFVDDVEALDDDMIDAMVS